MISEEVQACSNQPQYSQIKQMLNLKKQFHIIKHDINGVNLKCNLAWHSESLSQLCWP